MSFDTDEIVKEYLLDMAVLMSNGKPITPMPNRTWEESFTEEGNDLYLWFLDEENSSHLIRKSDMCLECYMDKYFCNCNSPNG